MSIEYSYQQEFEPSRLGELFRSVGWSSGDYPDALAVAMRGSHRVVSAWDGDILVGLMNALADGAMTAYFHYLLVRPRHQRQGIGSELVARMLADYDGYARKVLIAYDAQVGFYERCGFKRGEGATPVFITYLTT